MEGGTAAKGGGEGPWVLPDGWCWARLGSLGEWTGGGTPSKSNPAFWTNGNVPWVSPKDMKIDVIGDTEDRITATAVEQSSAKYVSEGSILMVMRSGILRHSFPVAVTDRVVTLNQDLRALTPHPGVNPSYVARYLASAAKKILETCSKDGTTVNSVDADSLRRLPVPIAPLAEQRRIVARIDALFTEIAEGEAALEAARRRLDTFRRALLKAAVTGELTKDWREKNKPAETGRDLLARIQAERKVKVTQSGHSHRLSIPSSLVNAGLFALPDRWAWTTLGELLVTIEAGINVSAIGRPPHTGETGIVKISSVTWGEFDECCSKTLRPGANIDERNIIQLGDFLFSRANTLELVGAPVVVKSISKRLVLSDKILRFKLAKGVDRWVEIVLKSVLGRKQIESMSTGTQLSMRNISQDSIRRIAIPLPCAAEMERIVRYVSEALATGDDVRAMLDAEAADAARLKQSILKAAFEGRLVPQDPAGEPASALLARLKQAPSVSAPRRSRGRLRKTREPLAAQ